MTIQRVTGCDAENWGLDEVVADKVGIHLERMSSGHIWMQITDGNRHLTINLHQKGRGITAIVDDQRSTANRGGKP
jgi:hypothetical protein